MKRISAAVHTLATQLALERFWKFITDDMPITAPLREIDRVILREAIKAAVQTYRETIPGVEPGGVSVEYE